MAKFSKGFAIVLLLTIFISVAVIALGNNIGNVNISAANKQDISNAVIPFIANLGMINDNVKYYADFSNGRVLVYDNRVVYLFKDGSYLGEYITGSLTPKERSSALVSYFVGSLQISNVPAYDTISYLNNNYEIQLGVRFGYVMQTVILNP
ncbi:MAG TPA: hypothetical protein VKU94_05015, partial [Geobacterales bacterium]|nr:hypothetical protein [Geobacterales bacterium]